MGFRVKIVAEAHKFLSFPQFSDFSKAAKDELIEAMSPHLVEVALVSKSKGETARSAVRDLLHKLLSQNSGEEPVEPDAFNLLKAAVAKADSDHRHLEHQREGAFYDA